MSFVGAFINMSEMLLSEFFKFVTLLGKCKLYLAEFMPLIYLFVMFFMMNRFQVNMRADLTKIKQEIRAKLKKNAKSISKMLTQHAQEVSTEITKIELKNNEILQQLKLSNTELRLSNTNANARLDQLLLSLLHNPNPLLPLRSRSVSLFK